MTYREWERYERERLASRNGVANDLRTRVSELEAENAELGARVAYLEQVEMAQGETIYQLYSALKALVEAVKPSSSHDGYSWRCAACGRESSALDIDEIKHAPDCAWWNAVQAMGRVT